MPQVTQADLTASQYSLTPMVATDTLKNLFTSIIGNIQLGKTKTGELSQASQDKLNEIISATNSIQAGSETDLTAVSDNINAIIELEMGKNGSESFVSSFQKLATELNRRKQTYAFRVPVATAPNGKFTIDVSSYSFSNTDYKVIVKVPTEVTKNISATAKPLTSTTVEVTLRNEDVFQDATIPTSFYVPEDLGAIELVVMIVDVAEVVSISLDTSAIDAALLEPTQYAPFVLMDEVPNPQYISGIELIDMEVPDGLGDFFYFAIGDTSNEDTNVSIKCIQTNNTVQGKPYRLMYSAPDGTPVTSPIITYDAALGNYNDDPLYNGIDTKQPVTVEFYNDTVMTTLLQTSVLNLFDYVYQLDNNSPERYYTTTGLQNQFPDISTGTASLPYNGTTFTYITNGRCNIYCPAGSDVIFDKVSLTQNGIEYYVDVTSVAAHLEFQWNVKPTYGNPIKFYKNNVEVHSIEVMPLLFDADVYVPIYRTEYMLNDLAIESIQAKFGSDVTAYVSVIPSYDPSVIRVRIEDAIDNRADKSDKLRVSITCLDESGVSIASYGSYITDPAQPLVDGLYTFVTNRGTTVAEVNVGYSELFTKTIHLKLGTDANSTLFYKGLPTT